MSLLYTNKIHYKYINSHDIKCSTIKWYPNQVRAIENLSNEFKKPAEYKNTDKNHKNTFD